MPVTYRDIRTDRQWKSATGMSKEKFFKLVSMFKSAYEVLFEEQLEKTSQEDLASNQVFTSYADLLFFGLYSLKSGLTYDLLGLTFGLSNSNAYEKQALVFRVLETALDQGGYLPKRSFSNEEELKAFLMDDNTLLLDATEQPVQRSANKEAQKKDYSGKKSAHSKAALFDKSKEKNIIPKRGLPRKLSRF